MGSNRVVIMGMGAVSPVGLNVESMWRNLLDGKSGIRLISLFDAADYDVKIAGEAWDFDLTDYLPVKEARRTDRFVHFSVAALHEVLAQSGLNIHEHTADHVGVLVGSGVGGDMDFHP